MRARLLLLAALALAALPCPAQARVQLRLYSYMGGWLFPKHYPHAFITLDGTPDAGGPALHEAYGFTTFAEPQAIMRGPVRGEMDRPGDITPAYMKEARAHFSLPITDAQLAAIREETRRWIDAPGAAHYNLNDHNCIHFVAAIARIIGMDVPVPADLHYKPRAYLNLLAKRYPAMGGQRW